MVSERKPRQFEDDLPGAPALRLVERAAQQEPVDVEAGPWSERQERLRWRSAEVFGLLATNLAWACTSALTVTFIMAAVSPSHSVLVTVNQYGEIGIEAVLLAITWTAVSIHAGTQWAKAWKNLGRFQRTPADDAQDSRRVSETEDAPAFRRLR
jgi:hypothetical protein